MDSTHVRYKAALPAVLGFDVERGKPGAKVVAGSKGECVSESNFALGEFLCDIGAEVLKLVVGILAAEVALGGFRNGKEAEMRCTHD
jgi:hypothetical protein